MRARRRRTHVVSPGLSHAREVDLSAFEQAGIELLFLEDLRAGVGAWQRVGALLRQFPRLRLPRAPRPPSGSDPAIILFTSGSEGEPKAVELTHRNLLANIRQMDSVIDVMETDRFFNALPLFHSFGLTVGLLCRSSRRVRFCLPLAAAYRWCGCFLRPELTVFFGTNTFLKGYARRGQSYDFRTARYLFAGAEKLQDATVTTWMQKFGVRILEGYGATECSPCISANTPMRPRPGSAGELLPGIEYRLEPVEGVPEGGRLFVRGPNVMRGYLNPEANAKFQSLGGWYDTGDIVKVDEDGYLYILGRLKRFARSAARWSALRRWRRRSPVAFPQTA